MSKYKNLSLMRLTILTVGALLANISSVVGADPGGVLPWITNGITQQILAAGQSHVLAVRADGTVWALGDSSQGQTGLGMYPRDSLNPESPFRKDPVVLTNISGAVAVAAGQNHSLVLDQNSNVWVFGSNDYGQIGSGNKADQYFPVTNGLSSVVAIQAGANYSMAVLANGKIKVWGANARGQLGVGDTSEHLVPTNVDSGLDFVAVACGVQHTLGLTRDGKVYAWGDNRLCQLGTGAISNSPITKPLPAFVLDQVAAIAAGQDFSMALRTNGTTGKIWVWGYGVGYRLGLGDTQNRKIPTEIPNHDNIWQIRAGSQQGYALDTASNLLVWGTSGAFGLGLGESPVQKTSPFTNNYVSNLMALGNAAKIYNADRHISVGLDQKSRLHWWGQFHLTVGTTTYIWPGSTAPKTPTTPAYDVDFGYSSGPTSRPVSPLAYVRGTVTNADLASFVLPLDFQKGVQLDSIGEAGAIGLLPFIANASYGYHFNSTNSPDNGQTSTSLRIKYKGPIAAFGSRVGGAPLYTDRSYRFVIYGGTPTLTNTFGQVAAYQDALQVDVYSKANFSSVGTFALPIRFYLDGQNTWDSFLTNGLTASVNKFGLNTTLSPRSVPFAYGVTNNGVLELCHNASDEATNYIFVVKMRGRNGYGWVAESGDASPRQVWQPLYSFEFVPALPWTVRFLSQIQFQKEPLPPFYDGKSLSELLTNSWNVTNTVSLPNPISSYVTLDASPELHSHPILDSFVDQMKHDPLALARFVQNEIELTDALDYAMPNQVTAQVAAGRLNLGGINRGALGTFLERQGSPTEQCALLIYLLRQAGIPAVYAFPPTDGIKMLDARVSKLLRIQIAGALDPNTLTTNSHSLIAMNYPWVAAYINDRWVHLFPWIKDTEIIEGPNLYDFLPGRYDNAMKWVMGYLSTDPGIVGLGETNDPPEVLFPRYVQQELNRRAPGLSFDELGIRAVNRPMALNTFDEFPRPTWVAGQTEYAESLSQPSLTNSTFRTWNPNVLAPAIFNTVRVTISHNAGTNIIVDSGELRCCDIHDRTFLVFHDRVGGGPPLRINLSLAPFRTNIDGTCSFTNDVSLILKRQLITTNLPPGATDMTVTVSLTWWRSTGESLPNLNKQSSLKRGDLAAICLNFGRVSKEMLEPLASTIWNEERKIKLVSGYKNNLPSDRYHGPLAYLMGMSYWEKVSRFVPVNQRLHGFTTVTSVGMGTAKLRASRDSTDGSINWENNKPVYVQPALDMFCMFERFAELPTSRPDSGEDINLANNAFLILWLVDSSAKEHDTLNKFFGQTAAISTVRLLQYGQNQDPKLGMQGIINVNQNNLFAMGELPAPLLPLTLGKFPMRQSYGAMWSQIEEAVAASPESQVLCTRGKLSVRLGPSYYYLGVGVLIIDRRGSYAALISEAENGGFSYLLPPDTFQAVNLDNVTLSVNSFADYSVTTTPINGDNKPLLFDSVPFYLTSRISDYATANQLSYTVYDFNNANQMANNFNLGTGNWQPNILFANVVATAECYGNLGWQTDGLKQKGSSIFDPVHAVTGEFYVDTVDLSLVGPFPLEIRRNYSSLNLADNSFGIGWKLAFTPYLSVVTNAAVIYAAEADGSVLSYESTNNSSSYYPTPYRNPGLSNNRNQGMGSTANLFNNRLERQVTSTDTNYFLYGANGDVRNYKVQSFSITNVIERTRPYLQQWTDNCGNYLLFSYGGDTNETDFGELRRVDSSNGSFVQFRYDVYGHIVEAFTGDGRALRYDYDQYGDLTKVTLPDASEISYEYQHTNQNARVNGALTPQICSLHQLTKELKPDGRVLLNVYDSTNRVIIQASTVGPDLNLVTNATFEYHNDFVLTNSFTNGITGSTDIRDVFGKVTHYDYSKSLITNIVDPIGQTFQQSWYPNDATPPGYPHSVSKQKDKRGLVTEFKYDSFGNVTNMITTGSLTGAGTSESSSNQAAYNANNLPVVLVDAIGNSNVIHYDAAFKFLPDQVTSYKVSLPVSTTRAFYANVTNEVQNGNTKYTNIACGLPLREVRAWGSPDAATNDIFYDGRGFPTNGIRYTGSSDPSITNSLFFNGRGELFQVVNGAGHRHHYDYDLLGRIKAEEVFVPGQTNAISWNNSYYNHNGEITWSDGPRYDPEDYVWRDYDGAGRKIVEARWRSRAKSNGSGVEAVPGDGLYSISSFEYDPFGNLTNSVDPLGNHQVMMYDAIGQMTQQVFYAADNTPLSTNTMGYEPGGKVRAATNSLGTFVTNSYTQTGLPVARVNPDGSTNGWLYYLDERIRKEFMPNGSYWETIYDDAHRRVTKLFRDPKGACLLSTTNIFDRRGNVITNINAEGAAFFTTYDGLDRPKITGGPATINGVSAQQISRIYYDGSGVATTNENNLGRRTVSLFDALQRPISVEIRDTLNNNTLVWKQTTSYASNHNSVTVTTGTGSGAVKHTTFADTFGKSVLEQSFSSTTITNFTRSIYDVAGNLVESRDELDQPTTFAYDGLNRLKSRSLPDRATVNFSYNSEGSLLGMTMPGGLTWSATYNTTNQRTAEKLTSGGLVARQFTNVYFGPGPLAGLIRQSIDLGRLVTNTYTYDVFLRVITNSALGKQAEFPEHTLLTTFQYDRQGRVTNLVQSSGVNPTTRIARKYDGYGQITSEQVYLAGALESSFNQVWDAAGRRSSLKAADAQFDYLYRVDDRMSRVTAFTSACNFNYANNGLLVSRSNPWRIATVLERDLRGRALTISNSTLTASILVEKLAWRENSTLSAYTANRWLGGDEPWSDRRGFAYNPRGQLLTESFGLTDSTSATADYGFDANLLGVRTSEIFRGDLANNWTADSFDGIRRVTHETVNQSTVSFQAYGTSVGALGVHGFINGLPFKHVDYNPLSIDGRWSVDLSLPSSPPNHTLRMGAFSRLDLYSPSDATSTFSTVGSESITDSYDDAGYVTNRTLTSGTQTLKWDAAGRLISTTLRNVGNNGYNWTAIYDGLGRRLRTTHAAVTTGNANANSQVNDSFFDPQVEFQEVGVSLNGVHTWKIFGPDLDGTYGSSQGLGGLEATYWQPAQQISGTVQDYFGNIPVTLDLEEFSFDDIEWVAKWSPIRLNSYGPVLGYSSPVFSSGISLADASVWRGKRIEATGFYWLGARYYDPVAGRFLSPDPLGHSASMDLYSFCDGDPLNRFDSDGRFGKSIFNSFTGVRDSLFANSVGPSSFGRNSELEDLRYNSSPQGQFMQAYYQTEADMFRTRYGAYFLPEPSTPGQKLSSLLNGTPLVGMLKMAWEDAITGKDLVTGDWIQRTPLESILGVAANGVGTLGLMSGIIREAAASAQFSGGYLDWQARNVLWWKVAPGNTFYGGIAESFGSQYARILQNIAANRAATVNISSGLITMDLRALTRMAAQDVDAAGVSAFTPAQQNAVAMYPNLYGAYRGSTIDGIVRRAVNQDPLLERLQGRPNRDPDFIDPVTSQWWDMTTPRQWQRHLNKYGPRFGFGGILLPTQ
jgi:RHS repeat-associated protein